MAKTPTPEGTTALGPIETKLRADYDPDDEALQTAKDFDHLNAAGFTAQVARWAGEIYVRWRWLNDIPDGLEWVVTEGYLLVEDDEDPGAAWEADGWTDIDALPRFVGTPCPDSSLVTP